MKVGVFWLLRPQSLYHPDSPHTLRIWSTATPFGSTFRTYPESHHFLPSSAAIILPYLDYCYGLLSQILPLPHAKSCSVFPVSFGMKPDGLLNFVLSCFILCLTDLINYHPSDCCIYLSFYGSSLRLNVIPMTAEISACLCSFSRT